MIDLYSCYYGHDCPSGRRRYLDLSEVDLGIFATQVRHVAPMGVKLAATLRGSRPRVQSASLYDNFCKTGNDVIHDVIIWFQDGNCKKMARENFSIGAFYNITNKNSSGDEIANVNFCTTTTYM